MKDWKTFEKIGDLLLGGTKEIIVRTDEAVKRIDKDCNELRGDVKSIDRRVARIEGKLDVGAIKGISPLGLTKLGKDILKKSGIKEMADEFSPQLLQKIREQDPKTAYDVQEVTKRVFKKFDFGETNLKRLKDYSFQNGEWGLPDILEVGAVYFCDTTFDALGIEIKNLNKRLTPDSK